jgi:Protein of unknown function (DUF3148)
MTNFTIGQKVQLQRLPPYVKTAATVPVLQPASSLSIGETGTILDRRPGGYWAVRFLTGSYLLEAAYLIPCD